MSYRVLAVMMGVSMLFAGGQALADDNICIINNASVAITALGGEGPDSTTYTIPANGGDENKCWAFSIGVGEAYYEFIINWGSADPSDQFEFGFIDPDIGPGYFTTEPASDDSPEWAPNSKTCAGSVCIYHTGKTDVWRLYVEDAPAQQEGCESALDECYNG